MGSVHEPEAEFEGLIVGTAAVSDGGASHGVFFLAEESPFELFQIPFVLLIEGDGEMVDFFGVILEEGFHHGVVEGVAEVGKSMHYPHFVFINLDRAFPLLLLLTYQIYCLIVVALREGGQDVCL